MLDRLIFRLKNPTVYVHTCHCLIIQQQFLLHSCVLYRNILVNNCPSYLYEKVDFCTDLPLINTRYEFRITPPLHSTALVQRSFSFLLPKFYRKIPDYLKYKSSVIFKEELPSPYHAMDSQYSLARQFYVRVSWKYE